MTETALQGEIIEEETGLVFCFEDTEDDHDEEFIFADPDDDPLKEIGGGIRRIKADGGDGKFLDDDEDLGRELDVVVIDSASTKHFWVPDQGRKPHLDTLLKGFPQDKPICYNNDMYHEEAKLHRDLSEDERNIMKSKGAGSNCNDCQLFKDCGFGRDLLVMTKHYEEPVVIAFPATSAAPLRDFFRKEFKHKGQSLALATYPVKLTFEQINDKDPKTGKSRKYWVIKPKRGRKLPNEKVKAFIDMRDIYRISNRSKAQGQLSSTYTTPPAQKIAASQAVGDPAVMDEEEMF